jgi:hypothetical protein
MSCFACERGDGPMSLHHWDDDGCKGTYGGATFTLECHPDPENKSLLIKRIEPTDAAQATPNVASP